MDAVWKKGNKPSAFSQQDGGGACCADCVNRLLGSAQKEDRFLRGRQIAYMISDYFRVTVVHDTVLDYAGLFSVTLRNDDVQDRSPGETAR